MKTPHPFMSVIFASEMRKNILTDPADFAIVFCLEYLHASFFIVPVTILFSIQFMKKSSWML